MRRTLLVLGAAMVAMGCGGVDGANGAEENAPADPQAKEVERAPDGSIRRPFLGGAFVTYNHEMPVDIDQLLAGEPTDHPVVVFVWAGE